MRWCCNRPVCIWASADADSNPICGAPTQYYNYSPLPSLPSAVVVAWRVAPSADLWEADPTMEVSHKERQVVEWEASPGKPATPEPVATAPLPGPRCAAARRRSPPAASAHMGWPSLPFSSLLRSPSGQRDRGCQHGLDAQGGRRWSLAYRAVLVRRPPMAPFPCPHGRMCPAACLVLLPAPITGVRPSLRRDAGHAWRVARIGTASLRARRDRRWVASRCHRLRGPPWPLFALLSSASH